MTTTYNITHNAKFDSYEVTFESKPATAVLDALKTLKMRWNPKKACWYGFAKESEILSAILENGEGETITGEKTEGATVYTDGYLGGGAVYGSKSNLHLYGTDLAKAIRADLKAAGIKGVTVASKRGNIQATITTNAADVVPEDEFIADYHVNDSFGWIEYFDENGRRTDYHIADYYNLPVEMREKIRLENARREYARVYANSASLNHYYIDNYTGFTDAGRAKINAVIAIIAAYRYDESNGMVDYFNTNFYFDIYTKPATVKPTTPDDEPTKHAKEEPKEEPSAEETAHVQSAEQAQEVENAVESEEPATIYKIDDNGHDIIVKCVGDDCYTVEYCEDGKRLGEVEENCTADYIDFKYGILVNPEQNTQNQPEPTPEAEPAETIPESAGEIPEENIEQTAITRYEDLTGKKFGALTVIGLKGVINSRRIWRCVCDCGNLREIREDSLKKYTRSCGDPRHRNPNTIKIIHGQSKTRLYNIWGGMKDRCFNPRASGYQYYGERGITVCDEWAKDFQSFYEWATQNGYSDDLSIDRIDTNGNYEPSNCRWATAKEQRLNQRQKEITYNGETHTLLEWSEITQIKYATLIWRYHQNWSVDKILSPDNFAENTKFKPKSNKNKHGSGS